MAAVSFSLLCFLSVGISILTSSHLAASDNTYIVHMDSSAMPQAFSTHHAWYSSLLSSLSDDTRDTSSAAAAAIPNAKLMYTYTSSINGFSASLTPDELEALKKSPGYISATPDYFVKPHTTRSYKFLGLKPGSGAWASSDYGKGVIIGLVDSGIWPESHSFKDQGMSAPPSRWKGKCVSDTNFTSSMCNNKIIGARYFNKGFVAKYPDEIISMNSTRDIEGHGTHTSSTAAGVFVDGASYFDYANGTAVGMAPGAWIAMYKVFWNEHIVASDALAAIDQAIDEGVDILSLSFSFGDESLTSNPISMACFRAMEKGIFVAASAGNDGPARSTLGNGAPWIMTVGAGTMDRDLYGVLTLGNGVQISFPSWYLGDPSPKHRLLVINECDDADELKKIRHNIVVCIETSLGYEQGIQTSNAKLAKVRGAIFISEVAVTMDDTRTEYPSAFLGSRDGQILIDYINKSSDPRASMEFGMTALGTKPAPMVDRYSSRGPFQYSPWVLKPDIVAPGTSVLAAWPSSTPVSSGSNRNWYSDYNVMSGTSMATPHVAGVAALIKAAHPDWSPAAIRSALMTTAVTLDNTGNPITTGSNESASPIDMGAGQVNPKKALNPGLIYDTTAKDYVQLLCAMNFTRTDIRKITRSGYKCLNPSLDLNYPSFIAYFNGEPSAPDDLVQVFRRTVTNFGKGRATYTAQLTPIEGLKVKVEPQKLAFTHKYERLSYNLTLEGPKQITLYVVYGHLSWVSDDGKHVVRSPIVATRLNPGDSPE